MENSRIFWIFVFIGFLCVVIFYLQSKVKDIKKLNTPAGIETFDSSGKSTSTTSSTATTAATAETTSSTTTVAVIPQKTNIGIYINAFLDMNGKTPTYQSSAWDDTYNPSTINFKFNTGIPPLVITEKGFPTKSIAMWGPSSENIASQNKLLGSFTVSFYMQTAQKLSFTLDSNGVAQDIELLQIFMQTPYYVIFFVSPDATVATNVNINALVGNSVYTWNIPLTSLVTGNMFSFVVDTTANANTPIITFYINSANINTTSPPKVTVPSAIYSQQLTLGVSQMIINNGGYLDANLWAFIYYNSILSSTDIATLYLYFTQQQNGYAYALALLAEKEAAAAKLLAENAANSSNLSDDLATCKAKLLSQTSSNVAKTPAKPDWSINAGPASGALSDSDLAKCSALNVNKFGEKSTSSATSSASTASTATASAATNKSSGSLKIAYPSTDIANATAASPHTVQYKSSSTPIDAYQSSSTPNYASPASFSFDFGSLKEDIFNFLST
jgi:hypothetical protein